MDINSAIWIIGFVCFICGFGWGAWWAERHVRIQERGLRSAHATITVPTSHAQAADFLELTSEFMRKAQERNAYDMDRARAASAHHAHGAQSSGRRQG
jgi:hypothetical protein